MELERGVGGQKHIHTRSDPSTHIKRPDVTTHLEPQLSESGLGRDPSPWLAPSLVPGPARNASQGSEAGADGAWYPSTLLQPLGIHIHMYRHPAPSAQIYHTYTTLTYAHRKGNAHHPLETLLVINSTFSQALRTLILPPLDFNAGLIKMHELGAQSARLFY